MKIQYDFKKEWPKTKEMLLKFSQDALELAKKGEERIVTLSQEGKKKLDATALSMKKEQIYYLIGKEYVAARCPSEKTPKIKKYLAELRLTDKKLDQIHRQKKKDKTQRRTKRNTKNKTEARS